jgi:hypothetical protein
MSMPRHLAQAGPKSAREYHTNPTTTLAIAAPRLGWGGVKLSVV